MPYASVSAQARAACDIEPLPLCVSLFASVSKRDKTGSVTLIHYALFPMLIGYGARMNIEARFHHCPKAVCT